MSVKTREETSIEELTPCSKADALKFIKEMKAENKLGTVVYSPNGWKADTHYNFIPERFQTLIIEDTVGLFITIGFPTENLKPSKDPDNWEKLVDLTDFSKYYVKAIKTKLKELTPVDGILELNASDLSVYLKDEVDKLFYSKTEADKTFLKKLDADKFYVQKLKTATKTISPTNGVIDLSIGDLSGYTKTEVDALINSAASGTVKKIVNNSSQLSLYNDGKGIYSLAVRSDSQSYMATQLLPTVLGGNLPKLSSYEVYAEGSGSSKMKINAWELTPQFRSSYSINFKANLDIKAGDFLILEALFSIFNLAGTGTVDGTAYIYQKFKLAEDKFIYKQISATNFYNKNGCDVNQNYTAGVTERLITSISDFAEFNIVLEISGYNYLETFKSIISGLSWKIYQRDLPRADLLTLKNKNKKSKIKKKSKSKKCKKDKRNG